MISGNEIEGTGGPAIVVSSDIHAVSIVNNYFEGKASMPQISPRMLADYSYVACIPDFALECWLTTQATMFSTLRTSPALRMGL